MSIFIPGKGGALLKQQNIAKRASLFPVLIPPFSQAVDWNFTEDERCFI